MIEQMRNVHPAILPAPRGPIVARVIGSLWLAGLCALAPAIHAAPRYELSYEPDGERMQVRLCVDEAAAQRDFRLHRGGEAFVEAPQREHGSIERIGDSRWAAADWRAGECLHYTARVGDVAQSRDYDVGARIGAALVVAPQQWLLQTDGDTEARVRVTLPAGYTFAPPWRSIEGEPGRYLIPATPFSWSALVAIGRFDETRIDLPGGSVRLSVLGDATAAQRATLQQWVRHALAAASTGHGELPLPETQIVLLSGPGRGKAVGFGQSLRGQGNAVHIRVDSQASLAALDADWTAVHEFSHWAHPYLGDDGAWLAEGLASYWQNVLRARGGLITPLQAWTELDAGFGRGRSAAEDSLTLAQLSDAMHAKRAYYAVYWSGAAFWLQVDVDLRRASGGTLSVDEAMRRFRACCLARKREWGAAEFVAKLDELIGSDVLQRRYREFAQRKGFPPLDALYRDLGIQRADGALRLIDDAPDASVRDAIMRRR